MKHERGLMERRFSTAGFEDGGSHVAGREGGLQERRTDPADNQQGNGDLSPTTTEDGILP